MPSKWTFKEAEFSLEDDGGGSGLAAPLMITEHNAGFPLDDVWTSHALTFNLTDAGGTASVAVSVQYGSGPFIEVATGVTASMIVCLSQYGSIFGNSAGSTVIPVRGVRFPVINLVFTNTAQIKRCAWLIYCLRLCR